MNAEIEQAEKLSSLFGCWPSFRDAEVWVITQERCEDGYDVLTTMYLSEQASTIDNPLQPRRLKGIRVMLRFIDCGEACLESFDHHNVLSDLVIEPAPEGSSRIFRVVFASVHGLRGELLCSRVEVCEAGPWQTVKMEESN